MKTSYNNTGVSNLCQMIALGFERIPSAKEKARVGGVSLFDSQKKRDKFHFDISIGCTMLTMFDIINQNPEHCTSDTECQPRIPAGPACDEVNIAKSTWYRMFSDSRFNF